MIKFYDDKIWLKNIWYINILLGWQRRRQPGRRRQAEQRRSDDVHEDDDDDDDDVPDDDDHDEDDDVQDHDHDHDHDDHGMYLHFDGLVQAFESDRVQLISSNSFILILSYHSGASRGMHGQSLLHSRKFDINLTNIASGQKCFLTQTVQYHW